MKKKYNIYIGIDCAPGSPRPNVYLSGALAAIGLSNAEELAKQEAYSKVFGAWQWDFSEELEESNIDVSKKAIKDYMDHLYNSGRIRGAEWNIELLSEIGEVKEF